MTVNNEYRPRRSCLYMPGANPRALEKAKTLPADMLILDLEDAVAPDAKAEARAVIAGAVGRARLRCSRSGDSHQWSGYRMGP